MTTFTQTSDLIRNGQDSFERHVHVELSYPDGGAAVVKVHGNGTVDDQVNVMRIGGLFLHLPKGFDADVYLFAGGDDTNQKHALPDIPRDKHRQTKAGTNGIQHYANPDIAIEISDKGIRVTGENFAVGAKGTIEVKNGEAYIRGNLTVAGTVKALAVEATAISAAVVAATELTGILVPATVPPPIPPIVLPMEPVEDAPAVS
jgi:hypothetical protein